MRWADTASRRPSGTSSRHGAHVEHLADHRGALDTARSSRVSRSSRAASSAWIVGGNRRRRELAGRDPAARPSRTRSPSSISIAASPRRTAGCPRRPRRSGRAISAGELRARRAGSPMSLRAVASASGSSDDGRRVPACRRPSPGVARAARAARCRGAGSAASRDQSARCSIRSRNVGSPQWMSSNTSDERPLARRGLEQPADRPEGLLAGRRTSATPEQLRRRAGDRAAGARRPRARAQTFARRPSGCVESAMPGGLLDDLGDGQNVMPSP